MTSPPLQAQQQHQLAVRRIRATRRHSGSLGTGAAGKGDLHALEALVIFNCQLGSGQLCGDYGTIRIACTCCCRCRGCRVCVVIQMFEGRCVPRSHHGGPSLLPTLHAQSHGRSRRRRAPPPSRTMFMDDVMRPHMMTITAPTPPSRIPPRRLAVFPSTVGSTTAFPSARHPHRRLHHPPMSCSLVRLRPAVCPSQTVRSGSSFSQLLKSLEHFQREGEGKPSTVCS